jgi:hypothetical protein
LIVRVADFLLEYQWVRGRAATIAGGAYLVQKGSGLGLGHSGDLCDVCYSFLVIRDFFGIRLNLRFKDDVILLVGPSTAGKLVERVCNIANYFRVELESASLTAPSSLDLEVFKHPCLTRLGVRHYRKPTALGIPLCATSGQALGVHKTWPRAMLDRVGRLRSTPENVQLCRARLRSHVSSSHIPVFWPRDDEPKVVREHTTEKTLWLPYPGHPDVVPHVRTALATCLNQNHELFQQCFGAHGASGIDASTIRFAWSNGG